MRAPPEPPADLTDPTDYRPHRQHYLSLQQTMETAIAPLRERLRSKVGARSPSMQRLAALDAVMEQVLGGRERALLGTIPLWLEKHFVRLHQAAADADAAVPVTSTVAANDTASVTASSPGAGPDAASAPAARPSSTSSALTPAWLAAFQRDMQAVLQAELDIRFQPLEGLLDALRQPDPRS